MQAVQFVQSVPRYGLTKALGRIARSAYWSNLSCLRLCEVPEPRLPTPEWVRIATRYGGICGSDLGVIQLHASTATSAITSFPFTLGHENVGVIAELGKAVEGFAVGQRVVVNPLLGCEARGFRSLCSNCARGEPNLCVRFHQGTVSSGTMIGFCRDTGGSWSPSFVAHRSQVILLPDSLSDEEAVLAEPFAVALHAVLRNQPSDDQTVLVLGAGVIGLLTVAALRAIGSRARVLVTARYPFQAEAATRLGADVVLHSRRDAELYPQVAQLTGAQVLRSVIGRPLVQGGADLVFDCVGSGRTIDDALRLARAGGRVVLVGLAATPRGVDWTPAWLHEVEIRGAMAYAVEEFRGERIDAVRLAVRLMAEKVIDLRPLVTHTFALDDYRRALEAATSKRSSGVIKAVFAFEPNSG
jgi:threonine dehydrogenase-like Zn-dependent dehydrogenase